MRRQWIWCAALLLLTACGAQTERAADAQETPVVETESEPADGGADTPQAREPAGNLLPDLDISAVSAAMPEEERAAFEMYLPVLRGEETFRWVAGPYDGYPDYDWEPFDADMAAVLEKLSIGEPPEALTLDRLAVQDIDGDGGAELVLLFQDGAYNYLVLHWEEGTVYGTSLYVRWFEGLQTNGVYTGAGGAGYSTYYQISFQNGIFEQRELGRKIDDAYVCYRELDGREVTAETFDAWYAENMVGDVTWYAPDGAVIPENM